MPINLLSFLSQNLLVLFLFIICIILLIFSIYLLIKYRQLLELLPRDLPQDAPFKGYQLLYDYYKKAKAVLGQAELDSIKVVADSRFQAKKMEAEYQKILSETTSSTQRNLDTQTNAARDAYFKFLNDLVAKTEGVEQANVSFIKQKTGEVFDKFEQNLTIFLTSTQEKSTQAIELELKAARELIDTYKTEQLKIVDENIIAILEKTLSLVITQKLSLKDHLDLVYESLEKAKVEKFVV